MSNWRENRLMRELKKSAKKGDTKTFNKIKKEFKRRGYGVFYDEYIKDFVLV